jgi:hypothetical protein
LRRASCILNPIARLEKVNIIINNLRDKKEISSEIQNALRILGMLGTLPVQQPVCNIEKALAYWQDHKVSNTSIQDILWEFERRSIQLICNVLNTELSNEEELINLCDLYDQIVQARQWLITFGLGDNLDADEIPLVYTFFNYLQAEFLHFSQESFKQIAALGPILQSRLQKQDMAGRFPYFLDKIVSHSALRAQNRQIIANRLHDLKLPLHVDEVIEALAKADLTINIPGNILENPKKLGPRILNTWHRGCDPQTEYGHIRNQVESFIFDEKELNPETRPVYAAANIAKIQRGSASCSNYGYSHIVLDRTVKFRTTYMPDDSFNVIWHLIDNKTIDKLKNLTEDKLLSSEQFNYLKNHLSQRLYSENKLAEDLLKAPIRFDNEQVNLIIKHSLTQHAAQDSISMLFSLENIIPWLTNKQIYALALSVLLPGRENLQIDAYVEAHVHGPLEWGKHVKSATLCSAEISPNEAKSFTETYSQISVSYQEIDQLNFEKTKKLLKFFRKG